VEFLLLIIELFPRCYGWCATSKYWLETADFWRTGSVWSKVSGRRGRPPQTILRVVKLDESAFLSV